MGGNGSHVAAGWGDSTEGSRESGLARHGTSAPKKREVLETQERKIAAADR